MGITLYKGISNNVILAQAGIYNPLIRLDPGLLRGDEKTIFRVTLKVFSRSAGFPLMVLDVCWVGKLQTFFATGGNSLVKY